MTGANHYLVTVIQSKTVKFSFFLKVFGKSTGANGVFWKSTDAIAPVAPALTEPLEYNIHITAPSRDQIEWCKILAKGNWGTKIYLKYIYKTI